MNELFPPHQLVNVDIALDVIASRDPDAALLGVGGGDQRQHHSFAEIIDMSRRWRQFPVGAVDYNNLPTGPDSERQAVSFGLRLFRYGDTPVAVLQRGGNPQFGQPAARVEVLTPDATVAAAVLSEMRELMVEHSAFRGQVITLGASEYEPGVGGITFQRRPELGRDDVILPVGQLERVTRHVIGIAQHREALRSAGQHLKRGVLLYGPPGTGKTHMVRYLIGALPGVTVVLLTGASIRLIRDATEMARALQPAVVVLEDCDLVAEHRDHFAGAQPLLFEVLDSLDGLAEDADVAFVLTTNRADLLEPALAQRPGRVDLAVEIPLPDEAARRALLRLYAHGLPFTEAALDAAAERAAGTTASFAKELLRRAVLVAADAGVSVSDEHLTFALDELLGDSEAFTRSLLGTPGADVDMAPTDFPGPPRPSARAHLTGGQWKA